MVPWLINNYYSKKYISCCLFQTRSDGRHALPKRNTADKISLALVLQQLNGQVRNSDKAFHALTIICSNNSDINVMLSHGRLF